MTIDQIHYFIELASSLNYSKAADNLFISQPTLSRQISNLEAEMGIKLFIRDKNHVELTPMGKKILVNAKDLYEDYKSMIASTMDGPKLRHILRAGIMSSILAPEKYNTAINRLLRSTDDVDIVTRTMDATELRQMLSNHELDYIITMDQSIPYSSDFKSRIIYEDQYYVMMSASNPYASKKSIDKYEFKKFFSDTELVTIESDAKIFENFFNTFFSEIDFHPTYSHAASFSSIALRVAANKGIALMNKLNVADMRQDIVFIPTTGFSTIPIYLCWNKDDKNPVLKRLLYYVGN